MIKQVKEGFAIFFQNGKILGPFRTLLTARRKLASLEYRKYAKVLSLH